MPGVFRWVDERAAAAKAAKVANDRKASSNAVSLFLPGVSDNVKAMPNHLARSSLFAPIAGRRIFHRDAIPSRVLVSTYV